MPLPLTFGHFDDLNGAEPCGDYWLDFDRDEKSVYLHYYPTFEAAVSGEHPFASVSYDPKGTDPRAAWKHAWSVLRRVIRSSYGNPAILVQGEPEMIVQMDQGLFFMRHDLATMAQQGVTILPRECREVSFTPSTQP